MFMSRTEIKIILFYILILCIPGLHATFENDALDLVKFIQVCDEILLFRHFSETISV